MLTIKTDKGYFEIQRNNEPVIQRTLGVLGGRVSADRWVITENGNVTALITEAFANGITLNGEVLTPENIFEKTEGLFKSGGSSPIPTPKVVTESSTTKNLTVDLSADRNRFTTTAVAVNGVIGFENFTNDDTDTFVVYVNNSTTVANIAIPTGSVVIDGVDCQFINMNDETTAVCAPDKSMEFIFVKEWIDDTHGEIRISFKEQII